MSHDSSTRSAQDFFDSFVTTPSPIQGQPTYSDLNLLRTNLYKEAAKVPSTLGGGTCGHLGLIMSPALYATVSPVAWVTPALPVLQNFANMTGPQIAAEKERYQRDLRQFQEIKNLDVALTRLITKTIQPVYLGPLDQPFIGLINFSTQQILDWLIQTYGRILPHQAIANRQRLTEPWTATEPFQLLNDRFRQVYEFAHDYGVPVTDAELITHGLYHLQNSGALALPLQKWHAKPDAEKRTWQQFVDFFQPEILEYQLTKTNHNHYAATAHIEATIQPLLQTLEIQSHDNHAALANMVSANNNTLHQQLAALQQLVFDLKQQVQSTTAKTVPINASTNASTTSSLTTNRSDNKRGPKRVDQGSYCWTHGFLVGATHNSATCTNPKPGHQIAATRDNPLGGNMRGKQT
jgi:hypothetical protein